MIVDIDEEKRQLLIDLVASRVSELHPTIRRCRVSSVKDSLKHDLEVLQTALKQLEEAAADPVS